MLPIGAKRSRALVGLLENEAARALPRLDQAIVAQPRQGFAHDRPRYGKCLGQYRLGRQPRAFRIAPFYNIGQHDLVNLVAKLHLLAFWQRIGLRGRRRRVLRPAHFAGSI